MFICSNRLKSKMAVFLPRFKIYRFHTISFAKASPSKTVLSRSRVLSLIDLSYKRWQCLWPVSSFSDKNGPTMTLGRGSHVSCRIFKEPSKGILVGGIKRGSQAIAVRECRNDDLDLFSRKIWIWRKFHTRRRWCAGQSAGKRLDWDRTWMNNNHS